MATSNSQHAFGGVSTDLKLQIVEGYLRAYTIALRKIFANLWYIDAFAGTGVRTVKHAARDQDLLGPSVEARIENKKGSAQIALDVVPKFDRLIFFDNKKKHYQALLGLKDAYPDRFIDVVRGDANRLIMDEIRNVEWSDTRAVMFLDPYGMHVSWETLEAIRKTEAIDVWYLVSLQGLFRQAARDVTRLSEKKRQAIIRMTGCSDWEKEWYRSEPALDLFGGVDESARRVAEVQHIEDFFARRLKSLFPAVLPPLRLYSDRRVPSFALFFAISNPRREAIGLASKLARHMLATGNSSQVRP